MSKQEVLALLLPYYKEHLEVVKGMEDEYEARCYLEKKYLSCGICYCASNVFHKSLYLSAWVEAVPHKTKMHWVEIPSALYTIPEIIISLQTRIDIMESLLQTPETANA